MSANLTNPFGESCCDGGSMGNEKSAQPCGCDPGINYKCQGHINEPATFPKMNAAARQAYDAGYEAGLKASAPRTEPSGEALDLEPFKEREERLTQLLGVLLERNYLTEAEAAECDDLIYQQAIATGLLVQGLQEAEAKSAALLKLARIGAEHEHWTVDGEAIIYGHGHDHCAPHECSHPNCVLVRRN